MRFQGSSIVRPVVSVLLAGALLAGCASKAPAPVVERGTAPVAAPLPGKDVHIVRKGDTMYSIALEHGLDYRELAAWNNITDPSRILVGQQLLVRRPGEAAPAAVAAGTAQTQPIASAPVVEKRALDGGVVAPPPANSDTLKREPKAGKEPYSEQALALAQGSVRPPEPSPAPRTEPAPVPVPPATPVPPPAAPVNGDDVTWIWPAGGKLVATYSDGGSKGIDIAGKAGDPVVAAGDGKVVYSGTGLRGYGKLVIVKHNNTYLSAYAHNQTILVKEGQSVSKGQKIAEMGNTDADQVKLHFEVRRQGKPVDPLKYLPQR
ncbi:MAG: peptidoglycan DD-metalloendopeptidase family protein [Proteobacteria bacterium]|jgi:lipoprotein NlpD|nr:peptidoglycan DD-metalloendopeptidase family protein [Pseudomonadota bacterium]